VQFVWRRRPRCARDVRLSACGAEIDHGEDGTVDAREAYAYGPDGDPTVDTIDEGDDGTVDVVITYDYQDGDLLGYEQDVGNDGDLDGTYAATYEERQDVDGDDLSEDAQAYAYDGDRVDTVDIDHAADGEEVDGAVDARVTYVHDGDVLDRQEYDRDLDGTGDVITYFEHDADGRDTLVGIDDDVDGTTDWVLANIYDEDGHLIERTIDNAPETPEVDFTLMATWDGDDVQTYRFAEFGQVSLTTYRYVCE
jgi:hypothetical protein